MLPSACPRCGCRGIARWHRKASTKQAVVQGLRDVRLERRSLFGSRDQDLVTITASLKFNNYMDISNIPDKSRCHAVFPRTLARTEVGQLGQIAADDHLRGPIPSRRWSVCSTVSIRNPVCAWSGASELLTFCRGRLSEHLGERLAK